MATKTTSERRGGRRIPANAQVNLRHNRRQSFATTRDVSQGGMFLFSDQKMEPGAELELILMMPEGNGPLAGRWVSCFATVVRVEAQEKYGDFGIAAKIDYCEAVDMI